MLESNLAPAKKKSIFSLMRNHLSAKIIILIFVMTIISTVIDSEINFHEIFLNIFPLPLLFATILSGFVYLILRPLKDLSLAAKTYSQGELLHRLNIHTGDEIEEIAKEFNTMAENLSNTLKNMTTDKDVISFEHNKLTTIIS
jgi:methyl-accepting chemotaxis protein